MILYWFFILQFFNHSFLLGIAEDTVEDVRGGGEVVRFVTGEECGVAICNLPGYKESALRSD